MRVDALQNAESFLTFFVNSLDLLYVQSSKAEDYSPAFFFCPHAHLASVSYTGATYKKFNHDFAPCKFFLLSFSHSLQQRYSVFWEFHIRI